ncbi:hypothetical protein [Parasphingorhabdus sp.]|uniref:hypothetical protein n=1 Tax=Parasphingorhabdus sp. TaxID=2709688 RepID=UPI0032648BB9
MSSGFPSHIEPVLDAYTVPALPAGFTDRIVSAATAQAETGAPNPKFVPWSGSRPGGSNSPWKRSRLLVSGVAGLVMLSTAAAAALSIAEIPYRIPVVSDLVETVLPRSAVAVVPVKTAQPVDTSTVDVSDTLEDAGLNVDGERPRWRDLDREGKIAVIKEHVQENEARVQQRRADRGLPPLTEVQLRKRRAAIRNAVRNGDISRQSVRRALRRSAIARKRNEAGAGRNTAGPSLAARPDTGDIGEAAASGIADAPEQGVVNPPDDMTVAETSSVTTSEQPIASDPEIEPITNAEPASNQNSVENDIARTAIAAADIADLKDRLPPALKERLRKASPAERRQMLRKFKLRRQNGQTMRDARQRLRDMRRSGR